MERALGLSPVAFLVGTVLVYAASICAVPDSFIVVSEVRHIRGLQLNVSAPSTTDVIDPVVTTRAIAVDFDAKTESLYWTDYSKKAILGSRLANSTNSVIVLPGLATPDGLAVDWIGNHIYYTDSALSIIGMVSSDGYYALPLVQSQLDKPRAIVLDPSQGMMYWTDWGAAPKIERSYMSGEKRELLINTSLVYPNGLALDVSGGLLYWVDAKLDKLERSRLDGSQRKVLVRYNTQSSSIHPFALTFFDSWLYWTDWRLKGVVRVSLESLEARRIVSFADKPMGIAVYDANRKSGSNGCSSNNGECQQVCLAEGTGRRCDCSYGTLNDDGKTCTVSDSFVLYSDIDSVRAITFTPNDDREASHPVVTTEIPFGVDFAWRTRTIFWTEQQTRRLMKAAHNERAQPTVVVDSHLRRPVSVAYDWMGGNIFFADMGKGSIDVCRSDGSFCRSLIVTDLGEPTSLAVDPAGGYLYWTDQKAKYNRIERSFMNGDKRQVIVPSSVLGAPKGLTLDLAARKIYWVEHHSNKIGVADLDGSNRATLVSNRPLLEQPVHLAHYNGHLYITTEAKNNVLRCRDDGSNLTLFRRTRNTPEDIKVVHSSMQNGENACSHNNGGCSQLCLAIPGDRVCACKMDGNYSGDCLPTVVMESSSWRVVLGESVEMRCVKGGTGVPISRVTLSRDGVVVAVMHDISGDVTFHLSAVGLSYTGQYACAVENEYGRVVSDARQLTVSDLMTATTSFSSVETARTSLSVSVGSSDIESTAGVSTGISLVIIGVAGGTTVLVVVVVVLGVVLGCRRYGRRAPRVVVVNPTYNITTGSHDSQAVPPPPYEECGIAKSTAVYVGEVDSKSENDCL